MRQAISSHPCKEVNLQVPVRLALANIFRSPLRSILTFFATIIAFLLFAVLNGIVSGIDGAIDQLGDTRLRVLNRTGPQEPLPIAYGARLSAVENVRKVTHATLFGGYYQNLNQPVSSAGVDLVEFLDVIPEMRVPPDQLDRVLASRTGAFVGSSTANRYGWRLGDRIPIKSAFWINDQGNENWTFEVLGIANSGPDDDKLYADGLFFDYRYLNESRITRKDTVHQFIVALDDPTRAASVAAAIRRTVPQLVARDAHAERETVGFVAAPANRGSPPVCRVGGRRRVLLPAFPDGNDDDPGDQGPHTGVRRPEVSRLPRRRDLDDDPRRVIDHLPWRCASRIDCRRAGVSHNRRVRRCRRAAAAGRRIRERACIRHRPVCACLRVADRPPSKSADNAGHRWDREVAQP